MSVLRLKDEMRNLFAERLVVTTTHTITQKEIADIGKVVASHPATAFTITLDPAYKFQDGEFVRIVNANLATVTVYCAEGFGGNATSTDNITLVVGEHVDVCVSEKPATSCTATGVAGATTTTLTATTAAFSKDLVGSYVEIAGVRYAVASWTSSTVIVLTGDATCAAATVTVPAVHTWTYSCAPAAA
jgi:hypothetical protein